MIRRVKQIAFRTYWLVGVSIVAGLIAPAGAQTSFSNGAPPNLGAAQGAAGSMNTGRPAFGPNVGSGVGAGAQAAPQAPSFNPPPGNGLAESVEPAEPKSGWKFPNLNPFRARDPERPMAGIRNSGRTSFGADAAAQEDFSSIGDEPPAKRGWKMPSLPKPNFPSLTRNDSPRPERPEREFQPLKKINAGARGFFSTARNTITRPFQRSETSANAAPAESRWRLFNRQPETPPQSVESANDWLKLPRPSAGN